MAYSASAFQLTHLLQRVYRRLKVSRASTATGGSSTTLVDSTLADFLGDANEDDQLNGGTIIIIKDAGGAGAAPEGEFGRITDYASSGTITWAPSTAPTAGDVYMFAGKDFPILDMIEIVNDALTSDYVGGGLVNINTSLITAALQTEYTLPSTQIDAQSILSVEIQTRLNDSNDNQYVPLPDYKIVPSGTPGTAGTLVIPQLAAGYTIRLKWPGTHARVSTYADYISESLTPAVAEACVVAHALQWYNIKRGGADGWMKEREDRAWNALDVALAREPIRRPEKRVGGFPHWGASNPPDEFYPIPLP